MRKHEGAAWTGCYSKNIISLVKLLNGFLHSVNLTGFGIIPVFLLHTGDKAN